VLSIAQPICSTHNLETNEKVKVLIFDNYDSFTYNLVHAVKSLGFADVDVVRNDRLDLDSVEQYDKIILSPGPGVPEEAGLLLPLIRRYADHKSMLGVCLGHQAIGLAFGAKLENIPFVFHGVQTAIKSQQAIIFSMGCPTNFRPDAIIRGLFRMKTSRPIVSKSRRWMTKTESWR